MADETLQQQPPTFSDELYKYAHDSGFIPKEATFDIFKKNLSNKDFVKELYDYSVQTEFIPKEATIDIFIKNIGGTTPAEKKNEKPATVSPVGGGSSGLLSVKFGGEDYEVNPTTQEVFKGGKPVTVPQNIKDYIAKNIIGVETPQADTSVGAVGADGQPMQPIGATGAGLTGTISDKVIAEQTRRGAGGGEEIRIEFTPQQQAKIEAIGLNPDQFRNSPLNEDFQKLAKQFAPNADFGDEKQVDQVLDDYQAFTAINKADNLAKELNIPRKQLSQVMKDQAAEAFLDVPEQAIFDIDKKRDEAVAKGATPEELKKIDEDRNKAVDFVLSKVDRDIVSLNKAKAFPNLTPEEIAKIDTEIANKKASYNNLTKQPSQIIAGMVKANPNLNLLDKKFKGLDDKQRLSLLYDGVLADLYTTGRDLGFSLTDIKNGKVDISTFFGFGEKGKKFVNLYNQAQQLAPAVLINKSPNARQDTFLDTFANSFLGGLSTAMDANTTTEQQKGVIISDFLDKARVEPSAETAKNLGLKLDDYGLGGAFWGQTIGGSAAAGASIALAEFGLGPIFSGMKASRYLAPIVDLMEGTKLGRAVRTGIGYEVGGRIVPASSGEADFLSGFVGEWATLLPVKYRGLTVPIAKLFGDQADKAAKIIGDFVKRGVGEMGQETAQSLYQIYRDTPAGQSVFDGIKQQFGDPSEALKFAISTFLMGGAMGGGSDLGMHRANVDAVKNLTPDEKTIYDTFTGEQRKKANADIIDIAKEQVTKVPTDNLQAQADNTQEAIDKLKNLPLKPIDLDNPDQSYSVEVDGIKYEGNNAEDLQSDIGYLQNLNSIINDELYKRNTGQTETPPIAEADKTDVELAKPEAGVGVEGEYTPTGIEEVKTEEIIPERVQTETTEILPQEGEVKETVEDTQVSEPLNLEEEIPFDIDNGFENQRKAGFIVEKGVKTNRKAPVKNKAVGKTVEVDFGLRDNPKAEYTVIEVDDIVPSHKNGQRNPEHFIPEAQPKNRSTAFDKASDNETIEIANNLKPERVAESPNAFSGAPVVNERGEVIQGNNRAESLRKHWLGQGAEYKQYLIDNAERLGINPDDIAKMKAPVLVRMTKVSDEGAIKLGQADVTDLETGGEKRLDPIKTANKIGLKDAKGLIDILADAPQDETLNQTIRRKAEALIDYLFRNGLVTRAQQASMIKNGVIVPRALEDIQNLFTQVLLKGSDPNLASIYENNTPNIVKQAIDKATPILLGLPKNVGITQNIQNALLGLDEFLKTGIDKVKEWANQPDMFNDGLAPQDIYSPLELVMIEQMAKAKRIIDVLNPIKEYAKLVTEQPATLFEEAAQPISKEQALKQVYGTEKSTLGTTERTPRLQEENGGTQQKPSGETTKGEAKSPTDREKTPPTEKVEAEPTADIDNVADKAGIAPKKAKKAAIQSDVIDKLVGNAANRREAYKEIADENIKEVAKIITDTNGKFDKVMDAIDNNDQLLADLEKKLGIKKICKVF